MNHQPTSESEKVIRRLYQITQDHSNGFDNQVEQLLTMGLERLGLDIAIISRIIDEEYTVVHCVTPDDVELEVGNTFDFASTYCSITCEKFAPVALEHIGEHDTFGSHPAYKTFGLEAYIGIPLRLNGELYGTLNFSSPIPFQRSFKDIDIDVLQLMASWIEVELIRSEQERKLKRLNEKLKRLADYDSLTGLYNRRGMYRELNKSLNLLSRSNGCASVAIVDIDHFKKINDTFGHQEGDKILIDVANSIKNSLRDYDFVARFGGEEFLVWLPNTGESGANVIFQRVMENVQKIMLDGVPVTVSIGVCCFDVTPQKAPKLNAVIDSVILSADGALYQAKNSGRKCIKYQNVASVNA